jgi:hypothetical protein
MKEPELNLLKNPIGGLVCIGIGLFIVRANLNVHSGEIFLWILGAVGFLFLFPIILFIKSVIMLKMNKVRTSNAAAILTYALAIVWIVVMIISLSEAFQ